MLTDADFDLLPNPEPVKQPQGRPQGKVRKYLEEHPDKAFTVKALADLTGLDPSNVQGQLTYMAKNQRGARRDFNTGLWQFFDRDTRLPSRFEAAQHRRKPAEILIDTFGSVRNLEAMQSCARIRLSNPSYTKDYDEYCGTLYASPKAAGSSGGLDDKRTLRHHSHPLAGSE